MDTAQLRTLEILAGLADTEGEALRRTGRTLGIRAVIMVMRLLHPVRGEDILTLDHGRFTDRMALVIEVIHDAARGETVTRADRPRCGARTRAGPPCVASAVWDQARNQARNGRCRFHGGASTGPRTPEGRARIAAANRLRRTSPTKAEAEGCSIPFEG